MNYDYLILTEKDSAYRNFSKALGGSEGKLHFGQYDGNSFQLAKSRGHLLTIADPAKLVSNKELAAKYGTWDLKNLPWDSNDFHWKNEPLPGTIKILQKIKSQSQNAKNIIIATDNDPSGEGELLAWEIINYIHWTKPVYRLYFEDESQNSIKKGFEKGLADVSDPEKDGDYIKARSRSRWDFLSMQLTRFSTLSLQKKGYPVSVVNIGRLKSVVMSIIYQRWGDIENFKKIPFYEVRFSDGNGHLFKRNLKDDQEIEKYHHLNKEDAQLELKELLHNNQNHQEIELHIFNKTSQPSVFLDLGGLQSYVTKHSNIGSKEFLQLYQSLYEQGYLSYPRTEDRTVTIEQFNELLPIVDRIADVVGVDSNLLTHREPRMKTHVVTTGDTHGANRPSMKVPNSLKELDKNIGEGAGFIYEITARSYLACLGEDYEYQSIKANLRAMPEFTCSVSKPLHLNFKKIFNKSGSIDQFKDFAKAADAMVYTGANSKPAKPDISWVSSFLEKNGVGTGATRAAVFPNLTKGKSPLLKEKKPGSILEITNVGKLSALITKNAWISSPDITKKLFKAMDLVGQFKMEPQAIINSANNTVQHDLKIMENNIPYVLSMVSISEFPNSSNKKTSKLRDKVTGTFKGKQIMINADWGTHHFTSLELATLFAGKNISFDYKTKTNKYCKITGNLKQKTYKGHKFFAFDPISRLF